jgi:hypothetical protein
MGRFTRADARYADENGGSAGQTGGVVEREVER